MSKKKKIKTALELEKMVEKGEDISEFLPKKLEPGFHKKKLAEKNVIRTTVDLGAEIAQGLEKIANINNISKAAVIKMAVLDYLMRFEQYENAKLKKKVA